MFPLIDNLGNFDATFKEELNKLREMVRNNDDRNVDNTILQHLRCLYAASERTRNLPNLLETFWPEEIECVLSDCLENFFGNVRGDEVKPFINFVFRTGYRDEPDLDDSGSLLVPRTTPLHLAGRTYNAKLKASVRELFNIYDRYDVNYADESGLTHFHVACMYDCRDVVDEFLRLGRDPNLLVRATGESPLHLAARYGSVGAVESLLSSGANMQIETQGDERNTPLHLALFHKHMSVAKLLLRRRADPTVTNPQGLTPLHVICKTDEDDRLVKEFLEACVEVQKTVLVDAPDNLGRTPLQWAMANLLPNAVKALLNYDPQLSSFNFPTESQFDECFKVSNEAQRKLKVTSRAMAMVELLERRGYQLDEKFALMIAKLFAKYRLFQESSGLVKKNQKKRFLRNDLMFAIRSKKILMKKKGPRLSLYALLRLRPAEAAKQLRYKHWVKFAASRKKWRTLPETHHDFCAVLLGEKMSRKFFQKSALEPFMELIHRRLPILCSEMIIDELMNKDLYTIMCVVASNQNDTPESNESNDAPESNDASENNESNDTLERNESNDASERNELNDAPERNESNDAPERNESNDAPERNESNDASERNELNDTSESNESNDASERNELNDTSESNESNDSSRSNESNDASESNESNDDFEGIFALSNDYSETDESDDA